MIPSRFPTPIKRSDKVEVEFSLRKTLRRTRNSYEVDHISELKGLCSSPPPPCLPHESQEGDERQAHHPAGRGEGPGHRQSSGSNNQVEHVHQPHLETRG